MESIAKLNSDLISYVPIEQLFQKHIIDGSSFLFREIIKDEDKEYVLRHELAEALQLSINDIVIVGSAKLGFSVKDLNFVKFDGKFTETKQVRNKSDIDIAVVSRFLFDQEAQRIYDMSRHFSKAWIKSNWKFNHFYSTGGRLQSTGVQSLFNAYTMNIARGWLRQDFSPNAYIDIVPWKTVSDKWYRNIGRKISIAVYADWRYLKNYQMDHLNTLREKARNGILNGNQ